MNFVQLLFFIILAAVSYVLIDKMITKSFSADHSVDEEIAISNGEGGEGRRSDVKVERSVGEKAFIYALCFSLTIPFWCSIIVLNSWFKDYNHAVASKNWEVYQGVMRSKEARVIEDLNRTSANSTHLKPAVYFYSPQVSYEFEMDGKRYEGTNLDFSGRGQTSDREAIQAILDELPDVGENVDVYIDKDQRKSSLRAGAGQLNYAGFFVGLGCLIFGMLLIRAALGLWRIALG